MDPLARFTARLLAALPSLDVATVRAVERELRDDLGGARHYIAAAPRDAKARRVQATLAAGGTLTAAAEAAGCTARHAARLSDRLRR